MKNQRWIVLAVPVIIAVIAVLLRYRLFTEGVLYGQAVSKMASLVVAGVIVLAGASTLWALRASRSQSETDDPDQSASVDKASESVVVVLVAVLALATTAYGVSELLAPNTPVAATAPACAGVPVYGARYFALTQKVGANARTGPGRSFPQANLYGGRCTLGFDGYCIGRPEDEYILGKPDQRWLIVHNRDELIAAAVVLGQTSRSQLGERPHEKCVKFGGFPQADKVEALYYDPRKAELTAVAEHAAMIGYVLAPPTDDSSRGIPLGYGKTPDFSRTFKPADLEERLGAPAGDAWIGAAVCLADNVPVRGSLELHRLTYDKTTIIKDVRTTAPDKVRNGLTELACNSNRAESHSSSKPIKGH